MHPLILIILHVQQSLWFFFSKLYTQETEINEKLSPEEQLAEKLRVKKLQEEADLELAREAFGKTRIVFAACNLQTFKNKTDISSGTLC